MLLNSLNVYVLFFSSFSGEFCAPSNEPSGLEDLVEISGCRSIGMG